MLDLGRSSFSTVPPDRYVEKAKRLIQSLFAS